MAEQPTPANPQATTPQAAGAKLDGPVMASFPGSPDPKDRSKDKTQELLQTLAALQERVALADRVTAQGIAGIVQQGADPARREDPIFRHKLAFTVQDVEKALGEKVTIPTDLRTEMTTRVNTAPGLDDGRILALLRSTSSIDSHKLVRDIRSIAFDVGAGRQDPGSASVQSYWM